MRGQKVFSTVDDMLAFTCFASDNIHYFTSDDTYHASATSERLDNTQHVLVSNGDFLALFYRDKSAKLRFNGIEHESGFELDIMGFLGEGANVVGPALRPRDDEGYYGGVVVKVPQHTGFTDKSIYKLSMTCNGCAAGTPVNPVVRLGILIADYATIHENEFECAEKWTTVASMTPVTECYSEDRIKTYLKTDASATAITAMLDTNINKIDAKNGDYFLLSYYDSDAKFVFNGLVSHDSELRD